MTEASSELSLGTVGTVRLIGEGYSREGMAGETPQGPSYSHGVLLRVLSKEKQAHLRSGHLVRIANRVS